MKETEIVPDYTVLEDDYLKAILDGTENQTPDVFSMEAKRKEKRKKAEMRRREQKKKQVMIASVVGVLAVLIVMVTIIMMHQKNASSFDYQLAKAESALNEGNTDTAAQYYKSAMNLDSTNVDVRIRLAKLYMAKLDYDDALVLYSEIIELDPANADAYRNMIAIYEAKNDVDSVLALKAKVTEAAALDLYGDYNTSAKLLALFSDYDISEPSFDQKSGTYEGTMEVSIAADADYEIYYTLDGSDPAEYGNLYSEPITLDEGESYELKAVCLNKKGIYSDVSSAHYTIETPAPDMPVVTPDGGDYTEETLVSIEVPTGCSAYYTWDGTDPNITSNLYSGPVPIPEGNHVFSVVLIENTSEKLSSIYRQFFTYYPAN
jgi:tetratricopeptide (TPR) repeat protein